MAAASLPRLTLVLGGARSGKSRFAEDLVTSLPAPWTYVATAEAWDSEMKERIAHHIARRGDGWVTREAPLGLGDVLLTQAGNPSPVLIDCLTLWLTNHLLADHDLGAESARLEAVLAAPAGPWFVVSNEVGLGIVPDNALSRRFRDAAGQLHQRVAAVADEVVLMVAGLPLKVK